MTLASTYDSSQPKLSHPFGFQIFNGKGGIGVYLTRKMHY